MVNLKLFLINRISSFSKDQNHQIRIIEIAKINTLLKDLNLVAIRIKRKQIKLCQRIDNKTTHKVQKITVF
jgi:hypothetical protein